MRVEWARLGDVLESRAGEDVDQEATYCIAGVYGFGRGLLLRDAIAGHETKYRTLTRLAAGDVVYSKVKAFEGAVAVVPDHGTGRYVSPEFPVFNRSERLNRAFARHYLASEDFLAHLKARSSGIGARRERVSPAVFLELEIPLPSIEDQRRIAVHLQRLESLGMTPSVGSNWARRLKHRLMESWAADLPHVPLGDVALPVPGVEVREDERYEITGVFSFGRGLLRRPSITGAETKYKTLTRLPLGAVTYSKLGAFEGAVAVVNDDFAGTFVSPEFPTFTVTDNVDARYLRHQVSSPRFEGLLAAATAGVGARQKRVSPSVFLKQTIPLPSSAQQREIADALDQVDRAQRSYDRASVLRQALLPAARNEIFSSMR